MDSKPVEGEFVGLASPTAVKAGAGGHPCQGIYITAPGQRPKTAIIAAHYNVDFSEHYLGPHFARRGFGFLGWNTRYRGAEDQFLLEHALIDIGVGVRWLREKAGAERIVILGNSGGGSLMAAYQSQAVSPELTIEGRGADALASLPAADLYISLSAHQGRPEVLTNWMDASVVFDTDPIATNPVLDPFNPGNGPPYSPAFVASYRAAQTARNQRITDWAKAQLARLNASGFSDRLFPLYRCWADLRMMDPALDPSERKPRWCYAGDPAVANRRPGIGRASMLKTWLSMWSLETSPCRGAPHLARIHTPALVVQSLADTGVFPSDAQAIHRQLTSKDKTLEFVKGAHYFEDSKAHLTTATDLMVEWIRARA
jgi:acetyl esterase/lipase